MAWIPLLSIKDPNHVFESWGESNIIHPQNQLSPPLVSILCFTLQMIRRKEGKKWTTRELEYF